MYPIRLFIKSRPAAAAGLIMVGFAAAALWYLLTTVTLSAGQFFLHYNIIFGVDLVGPIGKLLLLPISVWVVALLNLILSWSLYDHYRVLAKILLAAGVLATAAGFYGTIIIAGLNY